MRALGFVALFILSTCALAARAMECGNRAPDVATPGLDGSCDSLASYYAIERPKDLDAARRCAYAERSGGAADGLGGAGVLMMIYANGDGVSRDLPLAKSFACEASWAEAEYEGRIQQLDAMARDPAAAGRIDVCDHVTSGMIGGFCTELWGRQEEDGRRARYRALARGWTPAQRQALASLREAASAYFVSSGLEEVDRSGTGRNSFSIERTQALEKALLEAIESSEQDRLPGGGTAAATAADAELNEAYAALMARMRTREAQVGRKDCPFLPTVKADGVRDTQRAWLEYRDAFVSFAHVRHPQVPGSAWIEALSRERIRQLEQVEFVDCGE
jgi:uncharacterized protein YecT (DUF1311 family)